MRTLTATSPLEMTLIWRGSFACMHQIPVRCEQKFAAKKVKVYLRKWSGNTGFLMAPKHRFYTGKIINPGDYRSWCHRLPWLAVVRVGSTWSLYQVLMSATVSFCLISWGRGLQGCSTFLSLGLKQLWGLDVIFSWTELCFCGQQTRGFVPRSVWCWPEPNCPKCLIIKGVECKEGRKEAGESGCCTISVWIKENKGEKVMLKTWSFCAVTEACRMRWTDSKLINFSVCKLSYRSCHPKMII